MNYLIPRTRRAQLVVLMFSTAGLTCSHSDDSADPIEAIQSELTNQTVLYQTSDATIVQDGDWVRWRFAKPLSDVVKTNIYRGARNAVGGCDFNGAGEATIEPLPSLVTRERETAININQCLMEMEQAQVAAATVPDPSTAPQPPGHALTVNPATEGGPDLQLEDAFFHHGYFNQIVIDPVSIRVTQLVSHVDWNTSGSCIGSWQRYYSWDYFWQSSWTLWSSSDTGTAGGTGPCDPVYEFSHATFLNYIFCAATPTSVQSNVNFTAHPLTSEYRWSAGITGVCYWMLHYGQDYQPW